VLSSRRRSYVVVTPNMIAAVEPERGILSPAWRPERIEPAAQNTDDAITARSAPKEPN